MPRIAIAIAVVVSLLAGIAIGARILSDDRAAPTTAAAEAAKLDSDVPAEDRIARLERIIDEEREARIALEDTLAMLFEDIEQLRNSRDSAAASRRAQAEVVREVSAVRERRGRDEAAWMRDYQERRVARLVEGGIPENEARYILEQESEAEFKAMQAAWEAQREGEGFDPLNAAANPQSILRETLGDDAYARYLEAQGQPTSISVTQVLAGSPANDAGLQPGDQVVSYNGERVFNVVDLRGLTMQGRPGEDVVIEVDRDGVRMQLTVPRGPIGITGSGANVRGMRWWGG